MTTLTAVF